MPIFIDRRMDQYPTCWNRAKLTGLVEEAAKRRIKCYFVGSREDVLTYADELQREPSSLVLFLASNEEPSNLLSEYVGLPLSPIVFAHHILNMLEDEFSYVMSDLAGAMREAVGLLKARGCRHPALFAVDFKSNHDICRVESFKRIYGTEEPLVFDLGNGLVDCISELVSCRDRIDGLICINDFCALPLMRVLDRLDPDWNAKMLMLGFSDTTLAALHKPALTSVSLNYEDGGRAVVRLHRMLAKHEDMAHLHFIMKSSLLLRDTTEAAFPPGMRFSEMTPVSDAEIFRLICTRKHFMMLENLLNYADTVTLRLMLGLMDGKTADSISKELFISKDGLLYHLRKLKSAFGMENAKEIAAFLCTWINRDALESYIHQLDTL